jgi:hypothetical protein
MIRAESAEFSPMNLSVDASYRRQVSELWYQWQRSQRPAKQPGEFRLDIFVDPPMHGPDARNQVTFVRVPEELLRVLKENRVPYTVH